MHKVTSTRRAFMLLAAVTATTAVVGMLAIALHVAPLRTWLGYAIGCLLSTSWLCVMTAFYISDEPLTLKSGEVITKKSDPLWYYINFAALFGIGIFALLTCAMLMLTS